MILPAYYDAVRQLLANVNPDKRLAYIGFGTGTAAPTETDISLTDAYVTELLGVSLPDTDKRLLIVQWKLLRHEAVGRRITEIGLYTADMTLVARHVRGPIEKTSDMEIGDVWEILV